MNALFLGLARVFLRLAWVLGLAGGQLIVALGSASADAQLLVKLRAIEGIPYASARQVEASEVGGLAALLLDREREDDHARALRLLGISAHPGSFEALAAFAGSPPEGVVSAASFNARVALRHAFGYLAHQDDRALRWLLDQVEPERQDLPSWSYVSYRGPRLARLLRRAALRGLSLSGRPEARAVLVDTLLTSDDPELRREAASLQETHARVAALGPERALSGEER